MFLSNTEAYGDYGHLICLSELRDTGFLNMNKVDLELSKSRDFLSLLFSGSDNLSPFICLLMRLDLRPDSVVFRHIIGEVFKDFTVLTSVMPKHLGLSHQPQSRLPWSS